MNDEGIKVKCIYAGNKSDCNACSHAVTHVKSINCSVPSDACAEVGQKHVKTMVVCKNAMSKQECNQCAHAKPHLMHCGCHVVTQSCNTICAEEGKQKSGSENCP
ncbi:MAG: hypothetical protein PHP98_04855 [Kiritimatiellae bacterium]|nr:hypothetical protein [Kiritimatiellia bacterium]